MPEPDISLYTRHFAELAAHPPASPKLRGPSHRNPFYQVFREFLRTNHWRPSRTDDRVFTHPTMRFEVPFSNAVILTLRHRP